MTTEAFNQMCLLLRKQWTKRQGALFRLQREEDDSSPLVLCAGAILNQAFRAEYCKVWQGDNLLYEGEIESPKLQELLSLHDICFGELNIATKLDVKEGPCYCFGDPQLCDKECRFRQVTDAEPSTL